MVFDAPKAAWVQLPVLEWSLEVFRCWVLAIDQVVLVRVIAEVFLNIWMELWPDVIKYLVF